MGRPRQHGVTLHNGTGLWYFRDKGKRIYVGKDKAEALRRWHRHELKQALAMDAAVRPEVIADFQKRAQEPVFISDDDYIDDLDDADVESELADYARDPDHNLIPRAPTVAADGEPAPTGPTCQDVVDTYLAFLATERSRSHLADSRRRLRVRPKPVDMPTWLEFVGAETPIASLTRDHFTAFRTKLNGFVKAGTHEQSYVNKGLTLVKNAFNRANRDKGMTAPQIPALLQILETKKVDPTDCEIFTPDDFQRMMKAFDLKHQAIALIALNCALTNKDIALDLKWGDIRADKQYLDLTRVKNKHIRRTPLWSRTLKKLAEYKKTCAHNGDDDLVFLQDNGKPYSVETTDEEGNISLNDYLATEFRDEFKSLQIAASFRIFRKSAATEGLNGGDDTAVKMLLGNASGAIWRKYAMMKKGLNEKVKGVTDAIEKAYFG